MCFIFVDVGPDDDVRSTVDDVYYYAYAFYFDLIFVFVGVGLAMKKGGETQPEQRQAPP